MNLLDVNRLSVSTRDGRELLSGLSFVLEPGGRLGLIGESGSGKSLTALTVMGLLPEGLRAAGSVTIRHPVAGQPAGGGPPPAPASGEPAGCPAVGAGSAGAAVPGIEMVGAPERALRRVRGRVASVVFQEPLTALDPLMRIGRQVAAPIHRTRGLRGARLRTAALDALAEVGLSERVARAYPHEVSGGQRQRAAIAAALACRPALLIADEPTTALDVTVQSEILELLDQLVSVHRMALLFISHDLAVVARITDRMVVLKDGRAVESGTVAELLVRPRHAYTRSLVDSARRLDAALPGVRS